MSTNGISSSDAQFNVRNVGRQVLEQQTRQAMNLFPGDKFGTAGASSLFPTGAGGVGDMSDILARLGKKEKNGDNFDTSNAGDNLFSMGKDLAKSGGDMMKSLGGAMQSIMGIVKQLLPLIMAFF
jgi:hypothetical protein